MLNSYITLEYGDAVPPLVNGYGLYGLVVDPHRGVVEDVEDQYCVRCYLEFKVAPVCNIGMHHGPLLNPNRPFAKPKNIDSLNGFGIYRLLDEDTSRIQVFLIPARANQLDRRKPGKRALLDHSFEVIEERRGIFREHLLEMILTYPGRMCLPRQCFDDVHNRSKYTQKKSINQITGSSGVKKLPGLGTCINGSNQATMYVSDELTKLAVGATLLLCFIVDDADGRFTPSGRVVVYYDLPSPNVNWASIAGFYDNANGQNGYINIRRQYTNGIGLQCAGVLLEGYSGLQIYLDHIFVLG